MKEEPYSLSLSLATLSPSSLHQNLVLHALRHWQHDEDADTKEAAGEAQEQTPYQATGILVAGKGKEKMGAKTKMRGCVLRGTIGQSAAWYKKKGGFQAGADTLPKQ